MSEDGGMVERVDLLKKKLAEIMASARALREEKDRLESRVAALERELGRKNQRLALLEDGFGDVEQIRIERDKLLLERGEVRSQIEELLGELEGIELG